MGSLVTELADIRDRVERLRLYYASVVPAPFDLQDPIEEREGAFIHGALAAAIPKFGQGVNRWPMDSRYYLCSQNDMAAIIGWDWTDRRKYIAERFDCEDFAFRFKSMCNDVYLLNQVGLVIDWSGGHGYNVIAFADGEVWLFEPQNDQTVELGTWAYKMERADILM